MFIEGGTTPSRHQLYDSRDTSGSHHPDLPTSPSQAHFQLSHTKNYPAQKILAAWFLDIFVQINALEKTYPGSSPVLKFLFLMYSFLSLSNLAAFFFFFSLPSLAINSIFCCYAFKFLKFSATLHSLNKAFFSSTSKLLDTSVFNERITFWSSWRS